MKNIIILLMLLTGTICFAQNNDQKITQQRNGSEKNIYDIVDNPPSYPGGRGGLMKFLSSNIKYPKAAEKNKIEGRVICTFVVEKDGSISDIKVVTPVDPLLDEEAVRVIGSMDKWNPGTMKGKPVRVKYTLPVNFKLIKKPSLPDNLKTGNKEADDQILNFKLVQNSLVGQLSSMWKGFVTNKVEQSFDGKSYERNYYNDDCIEYTLIRGTDKTYTIQEGKNTLYNITKELLARDNSKDNSDMNMLFAGKIVNKNKLDKIVFAMPVQNGKMTRCRAVNRYYGKDSVEVINFNFEFNPGDTIYAVRSGVACPDVVANRLYIYHEDGSLTSYTNIQKLVKHTDRIIAGQPIGVIATGKKSIRLTILYLDNSSLKMSAGKFPYKGYSPLFRTTKGDVHIVESTALTPNTDDELRMQEMTSKEKKKLMGK